MKTRRDHSLSPRAPLHRLLLLVMSRCLRRYLLQFFWTDLQASPANVVAGQVLFKIFR